MKADKLTASNSAEDVDDIYVDKEWKPKRGEPMPHMDGYYVGKKFGAGKEFAIATMLHVGFRCAAFCHTYAHHVLTLCRCAGHEFHI